MATGKSNTGANRASIDPDRGAFFVGQVAEVLEGGADQLRELSTLLCVIRGLIDDSNEDSNRNAADLTSLAIRRLGAITADVDATRDDCVRQVEKLAKSASMAEAIGKEPS